MNPDNFSGDHDTLMIGPGGLTQIFAMVRNGSIHANRVQLTIDEDRALLFEATDDGSIEVSKV